LERSRKANLRKTTLELSILSQPTYNEEARLRHEGYRYIAGIDEAGRGAIVGPVVAAAVILPQDWSRFPWFSLVKDSKLLSPSRRKAIFQFIQEADIPRGVGMIPPGEIDAQGIVKATQLAMAQAMEALPITPEFLLVDALTLPEVALPQKGLIHGDRLCLSIACASIVAKVSRDNYMIELDKVYPGYGLARHKGYFTREHSACLSQLGPCPLHRRSFAPVRQMVSHLKM
jgi:ribonuclease HII